MTLGLVDKWKCVEAMLADDRLSKADVMVGAALLDLVRADEGCAYPGFGYLADRLSLGRSTIVRAVKKLEAAGYFDIERSNGGRQNSNRYRPRALEHSSATASNSVRDDTIEADADQNETETVSGVTPLQRAEDAALVSEMTPLGPETGAIQKKRVSQMAPLDAAEPQKEGLTVSIQSSNGVKMVRPTVSPMTPDPSYINIITHLRAGAREDASPAGGETALAAEQTSAPATSKTSGCRRRKPKRPDPRQPEMLLPIAGGHARQAKGGETRNRSVRSPQTPLQWGQMVQLLGKAGLRADMANQVLMRLSQAQYDHFSIHWIGKAPETALRALHRAITQPNLRKVA